MHADLILNFLLNLIIHNPYTVPQPVWLLAVWRVARLRGLSAQNYEQRVLENVADTLKEAISDNFLNPFFLERHLNLSRRGKSALDVIDQLIENVNVNNQGEQNVVFTLSQIYESFDTLSIQSPYYGQALEIALSFF